MDTGASSTINFKVNDGVATFSNGSTEIANFDLEGRLISYTRNGITYRRTISNTFYKIGTEGNMKVIDSVAPADGSSILEGSYNLAREAVKVGNVAHDLDIARKVASRDLQWADSDSRGLLSLYSAIPVVPPDQPSAFTSPRNTDL